MTAVQGLRVTFDTNVCNFINDPNKPGSPVDPVAAATVRTAVSDGRVKGFISEASLFVECLNAVAFAAGSALSQAKLLHGAGPQHKIHSRRNL
jgi:hypothetical protein